MKQFLAFVSIGLCSLFLVGCGDGLPEANEENCTIETILSLKDKEQQHAFAKACDDAFYARSSSR